MGVWSYPDVSLEDLMKVVKGFVEMVILASGYQSSGRVAHWDSDNIKKALQWALFIENMQGLSSSDDCKNSLEELDVALCEMTSNPLFPQGLAELSSKVLSKARDFMLEHLISAFPLRTEHLKALVTANVEMDCQMHQKTESGSFDGYFKTLMCNTHNNPISNERNYLLVGLASSLSNSSPTGQNDDSSSCGFSLFAAQELERRQLAVSLITSAETNLDVLSSCLRDHNGSENGDALDLKGKHTASLLSEEKPVDSAVWNCWKSRNLSYLLDRRTIRLVAGASLLFSAPKSQWNQVFQRIDVSSQPKDSLCEIVELLLLGCVVDKWSSLIECLMFTSYEFVATSKLYNDVHNLVLGGCGYPCCRDKFMSSKDRGIIEYLEVLLRSQPDCLLKLSPVLAAVAIPSWSHLFRAYLTELDSQFQRDVSLTRSYSCVAEGKKHRECDVAERIWCLHVFHIGF